MTDRSRSVLKESLLGLLDLRPVARILRATLRERCIIFMLHRFHSPDRKVEGHDPALVSAILAALRRDRVELLGLREAFERLGGSGPPLRGAVCFTLDDGYAEHAEVASPLFAEFDCPVTTFAATGFLDGEIWYWWDRVEYAMHASARPDVTVELASTQMTFELEHRRERATEEFVDACKVLPPVERDRAIDQLAMALDVEIPQTPPQQYAPMSWADLKCCERRGMTFGPHTIQHPILGRCSDEASRSEIEGSWKRLRQMADDPVPIFCYPNGKPGDFGPREFDTVTSLGLLGAVSSIETYASRQTFVKTAGYRCQVPRFPFTRAEPMRQVLTGFTRVKELLRGGNEEMAFVDWKGDTSRHPLADGVR
jgi:peptidoglycan/xylan/chitin deacetylase (PgdA/CDA1 family)